MIKILNPLDLDLTPAKKILTTLKTDHMAGWLTTFSDTKELERIKSTAAKIQQDSDYLVCIGIGGSYLGHRAIIEALGEKSQIKILYAGNSLSSYELDQVIKTIGSADFSINVISKSGTTIEPAIAFRFFKQKLLEKYGDAAHDRIYATTDAASGALHDEAIKNHYTTFTVPDDVGGRYSVLTPVGLLPLAVAGVDIDELLHGATEIEKDPASIDQALTYATYRQYLAAENYDTEVLASTQPRLLFFHEWWKQLFGESEGKNSQGIFPAAVIYTTDLHSMGQFMQDGRRNIFETFLEFKEDHSAPNYKIPVLDNAADGLDHLAGKSLEYINEKALRATVTAHRAGHLPVIELQAPDFSAHSMGQLIYFFELACAISGKLQGVNPFDQPGVEAYKTELKKLLAPHK